MSVRWNKIIAAWKTFPLDLKVIPFLHLKLRGKHKQYAEKHLTDVCAHCPQSRKLTRDVNGDGSCWWIENWNEGNYDIPADFGLMNLIRFYTGSDTKLDAYKEKMEVDADER